MTNKKVAIIGAGIVGLYLAKELQEKGFEVSVFEKEKEIGKKPCTALISERIFNYIPEAEKVVKRKIDYLIAHFPKKDIQVRFNPSLYLFERGKLDNLVASLAREKGVKIQLGKKIEKLPDGFFRIIGCDGALSKTREILGENPPFLRLGLQCFLEKDANSKEVEIWPKKEISGFLWRVPRREIVEYGAIGDPKNTYQIFLKFLKKRKVEIKKENLRSALIPLGIVLPKNKKIILCGDAAGLTTPTSGGGIIWGLKSAKILVEEFPDFLSYRKKGLKFFWPKIQKAKILTKIIYTLSNTPFVYLFPKKVEIDTNLFYSFLRYKIYF
ncbi:MAG: FAD-dependent oxidoreductase [Candidatus Pacebacteria bacterium]|nr:FAD-dependent oxidoreductase [Candidatus Paceibacterota bacterium]